MSRGEMPTEILSMSKFNPKSTRLYPVDLIAGAMLWFGLFAVVAAALFPPHNGEWGETFKAIGVAIAVAGGIFSPMSTIVMARYQSQLTADLERLKAEYGSQIEALKSSLSA